MQRTVSLKQDKDRIYKAIQYPIFTGSKTCLYFNQERCLCHTLWQDAKEPSRMALMHTGIILINITKSLDSILTTFIVR